MSVNHGRIRGESILVYLEAREILARIGPDPDAETHRVELTQAIYRQKDSRGTPRLLSPDVIDEVAFLASSGEPPEAIARALNVKPATLSRSLYRAGRPDLAKGFEHLVNVDRWARRTA